MPKTIDYPRTTYVSAWEVAEVVDDTGGKCAIDTAAKKLSRKVSGSFKAIIGSAVKFGLLTSKREILTTTNLYRRIKHAYDKQEEKIFHREAFLHPPLFMQICRKFRNRELPVHMFDVMLIREFGVEEINAQNVAKAFVEGARAVDILDERNVIVDVDQLAAQQSPRRELASTEMPTNLFGKNSPPAKPDAAGSSLAPTASPAAPATSTQSIVSPSAYTNYPAGIPGPTTVVPPLRGKDAVSSLFGLDTDDSEEEDTNDAAYSISEDSPVVLAPQEPSTSSAPQPTRVAAPATSSPVAPVIARPAAPGAGISYSLHISGPGIESQLVIQDVDDLEIASILLEKIRKQLSK